MLSSAAGEVASSLAKSFGVAILTTLKCTSQSLLLQQWWRLNVSEKFLRRTKNINQLTQLKMLLFNCIGPVIERTICIFFQQARITYTQLCFNQGARVEQVWKWFWNRLWYSQWPMNVCYFVLSPLTERRCSKDDFILAYPIYFHYFVNKNQKRKCQKGGPNLLLV